MWRTALVGLGIVLLCFLANCGTNEVGYDEKTLAAGCVRSLGQAVEAYHAATDEWPQSLQQLTETHPLGLKPLLRPEDIIDPWNQPYQYQPPPGAKHNGPNGPDVWTVVPDEGTVIGNWRKN